MIPIIDISTRRSICKVCKRTIIIGEPRYAGVVEFMGHQSRAYLCKNCGIVFLKRKVEDTRTLLLQLERA